MTIPPPSQTPASPSPVPADPAAVDPAAPFDGLTVLVTGEIAGISRAKANEHVALMGGKAVSAVSGKVDLVVAGDGAGVSKMDKARQHGCLILTGDAFADLATGRVVWDGQRLGITHAEWESRDAEARGSEDDEPRSPRPGDPDWVPLADRHLVGLATDYFKRDGVWGKQFRLHCIKADCGHLWVEPIQHDRYPKCPVEAGLVDVPNHVAPWLDDGRDVLTPVAFKPSKPRQPKSRTRKAAPAKPGPDAPETTTPPGLDEPGLDDPGLLDLVPDALRDEPDPDVDRSADWDETSGDRAHQVENAVGVTRPVFAAVVSPDPDIVDFDFDDEPVTPIAPVAPSTVASAAEVSLRAPTTGKQFIDW